MILGISASGRPEGVTAEAVRAVLDAAGEEVRFISLAGKLGVSINLDGGPDSRVRRFIEPMMTSNKMAIVGNVAAGNVVARHGFVERIEEAHLPPRFSAKESTPGQARRIGRMLGSILRAGRKKG